jgi:hypothetical protein
MTPYDIRGKRSILAPRRTLAPCLVRVLLIRHCVEVLRPEAQVSPSRVCPGCRFENGPQMRFCGQCGAPLYAAGPIAPPPPVFDRTTASGLGTSDTGPQSYPSANAGVTRPLAPPAASPPKDHTAKALGMIAAVLSGAFILVIVVSGLLGLVAPRPAKTVPVPAPPAAAVPAPAPAEKTSAEHLAEGKRILAQVGYAKPDEAGDLWRVRAGAEREFRAIQKGAKEYKEAQRVLAEMERTEKDAKLQSGRAERRAFAVTYERSLLGQGIDAHVTVSGKYDDVLNVKYILVSRPMAYQLSQSEEFIGGLRKLGFSRVNLEDGYDSSWYIDLK